MEGLEATVNMVYDIAEKVKGSTSMELNEDLFTLLHNITSSLTQSLAQHPQHEGTRQRIHREYLEKIIQVHHSLLQVFCQDNTIYYS